jgi:hypothetical protein
MTHKHTSRNWERINKSTVSRRKKITNIGREFLKTGK